MRIAQCTLQGSADQQPAAAGVSQGIGIGIFNDNIDENQTTTNHHGLQDQGMRPPSRIPFLDMVEDWKFNQVGGLVWALGLIS